MSDAVWEYLYASLPWTETHRWGGDWREFRDGVLAAVERGDVGMQAERAHGIRISLMSASATRDLIRKRRRQS